MHWAVSRGNGPASLLNGFHNLANVSSLCRSLPMVIALRKFANLFILLLEYVVLG